MFYSNSKYTNMQREQRLMLCLVIVTISILSVTFITLNSGIRKRLCGRCRIESDVNINTKQMPQTDRNLMILLWNATSGWILPEGPVSDRDCDVTNCWMTHDVTKYKVSDAVIFYPYNDDVKRAPTSKPRGQVWVYFEKEPPKQYNKNYLEPYQNLIDITMTYRRDSEIPVPYGWYTPLTEADDMLIRREPVNFADGRKNSALWFVSHCGAKSMRDEYTREVREYFPVDVYGRCGDRQCRTPTNHQCFDVLKGYKFYFAFENMICEDYITEKLWRTLNFGILPVVLGGAAYIDILPPNSYLDIKNFSSPKKLADHLRYLSDNDAAYNRYFSWRRKYKVVVPNVACELCRYLSKERNGEKARTLPKKHESLHDWWAKDKCKAAPEYYKGSADMIN